jgi:hypothetical protein
VEKETREGAKAYASFRPDVPTGYREGWLPNLT